MHIPMLVAIEDAVGARQKCKWADVERAGDAAAMRRGLGFVIVVGKEGVGFQTDSRIGWHRHGIKRGELIDPDSLLPQIAGHLGDQ